MPELPTTLFFCESCENIFKTSVLKKTKDAKTNKTVYKFYSLSEAVNYCPLCGDENIYPFSSFEELKKEYPSIEEAID